MKKEIKFTDKAIKQIELLLNKKDSGTFFRIAILGGGCSGFKYDFSFDKEQKKEDLKFNKVLIDENSANMLSGSEIDFVSELIGTSFKINNPQSKSSCGCGVSFAI